MVMQDGRHIRLYFHNILLFCFLCENVSLFCVRVFDKNLAHVHLYEMTVLPKNFTRKKKVYQNEIQALPELKIELP